MVDQRNALGIARNGRAVVSSLSASPAISAPPSGAPAVASAGSVELVKPRDIRRDGGTQLRFALNQAGVVEYQKMIAENGGEWPFRDPVSVVRDGDGALWLYDGFHRLAAWGNYYGDAALLSVPAVPVVAVEGDKRLAVLLAAGANIHGVARSDADKRKAVDTLLLDPEWGVWSDGEIARRCGVSRPFVTKRRGILDQSAAVAGSLKGADPAVVQYRNKHGGVSAMKTGGIADANRARSASGSLASGKLGGAAPYASGLPALDLPAGGPSVVASAATGSRASGGVALAKCTACGRPLTDPASAVNGMGPCCAAKAAKAAVDADVKRQQYLDGLIAYRDHAVAVLDGADLLADLGHPALAVEVRRVLIDAVRAVGVKIAAEGV